MSAQKRSTGVPERQLRVVELFAGVGGFRLGLEGVPEPFKTPADSPGPWKVVWANQWEPSTKKQHAFECYSSRFADGIHDNRDIATVPADEIPDHDLLVGGFPCQDYSVAKPLNQARGIEGRKGVLWWEIRRIIDAKRPGLIFLENVDRLLRSPGRQRGRDFAVMLAALSDLGYLVEWRVVNAADYGFGQRRRRVFIVGKRVAPDFDVESFDGFNHLVHEGVLARALPVTAPNGTATHPADFELEGDLHAVSEQFNESVGHFFNAGVMVGRQVWSRKVEPIREPKMTLGSILESEVPEEYFVSPEKVGPEEEPYPKGTWRYLKGAKNEERQHKESGAVYRYTEGALPFPDKLDEPARTILTGEGGSAPSRFKHVVQAPDGRFRRLAPVELEKINGFPARWTEGMSDVRRAFCMGNALVVGVVRRIGSELAKEIVSEPERKAATSAR